MPRIVTRRSRRQVLSMGAGALGTALLAACGGLTEEQPPASTPFPSIPLPASYPGANATPGGVLRLGALTGEQRTQALRRLTGAQLVAVDPRTAIVYADLAESVELPEPLTVVFTLRQGLRFHPDARGLSAALTSGDVAREFQARAAAGEHLFSEVVERVETPDQRTVILHLRGRFSQLFESLGGASTGAVRSVQRSPVSGEQLGSGPFVPFAGEAGGEVLARHPLYHRPGLPLLDGVAVLTAEDEGDLAETFARGGLDFHAHAAAAAAEDERETQARADAVELQRPAFAMMGLGLSLLAEKGGRAVRSVPAFQDPRVRRAVSVALDRRAIGERFEALLSGPVGPAHRADALPDDELAAHPLNQRDPAGARALLAAAGAPDLAFTLRASAQPLPRALGRLVEEQLLAGGFAPRLQLLEARDWERSLHAGDFEAAVFELEELRTPDLGLRLHTSAGVDGTFSLWGYSNPVYDAAVREVLSELDPVLRAARSREAQRLLLEDVPAMFPLGAPLRRASIAARVRGYEYGAYAFNDGWLSARWSVSDGEGG